MKKLKIGVIGLGCRGNGLLTDVMLKCNNIEITAVCDLYEDRIESVQKLISDKTQKKPVGTTDYKEVVDSENVDAIIITAEWKVHFEIAEYAMEKHKPVGMEVSGAYSLQQCWDLVHTYERTKTPIMMLENCCFGRRELLALNMVKMGLFGDVVYCKGGYHHDLREEIAFGKENRHYRLKNYIHRSCENYPTHEIGPIAQILNINHGNRMVSLSSVGSSAKGLHEYVCKKKSDDKELMNTEFMQSDVVVTNIKCAGGQLITITLDTTLPRYYCRDFTVRGTKAMYEEISDSVFLDDGEDIKFDYKWKEKYGNVEKFFEKYDHPIWQKYIKEGVMQGGHDGMDWLTLNAFFDSVINNTPCPIDVYDAATWASISALSEISMANGGLPVEMPDFTNGEWIDRKSNF